MKTAEQWIGERSALQVVRGTKAAAGGACVRSDYDIARSATRTLDWNLLVPSTVKVKVAEGRVTLGGPVEFSYQRIEAERAIRDLAGVRSVLNRIEVVSSDMRSFRRSRTALARVTPSATSAL